MPTSTVPNFKMKVKVHRTFAIIYDDNLKTFRQFIAAPELIILYSWCIQLVNCRCLYGMYTLFLVMLTGILFT